MDGEIWLKMACPHGITIIPDPEPDPNACPVCGGKGYIVTDRIALTIKECECAVRARVKKRLARSGLGEVMTHSTLDTFKTPEAWQYKLKDLAMQYIINARTAWFFVSGTPGSGKTHICSAIINKLVEYAQDVRYLKWREVIPQLKRVINDSDAFNAIMKPLKECDILYIDDFLKGSVTEADINLAYELINYRYAGKKRTIISGERSIDEIIELDEALGSRIYERSRRYHFETPKGANWRLK